MRMFALTVLLAALVALPASADEDLNQGFYMGAFAGYLYSPEGELPDSIDDVDVEDLTFGIEAGWMENRLGVGVSLSRYVESYTNKASEPAELETLFLDASFVFNVMRGNNFTWSVFGGPGWAFVDADSDFLDDSLTLHAGTGWRVGGDRFFFRPSVVARYTEKSGDLDYEGRVGFGVQF